MKTALTKIVDGDVLLVFSRSVVLFFSGFDSFALTSLCFSSMLILKLLLAAKASNTKFRVIIVDARPKMAGLFVLVLVCYLFLISKS